MPQPIRHRRATVAVAALFAGAPPLVSNVAAAVPAAPARESGREIVFTGGGRLGLRCAAKPSRTSVTVPPQGTLRVVNDTSRRVRLILDGSAQGELPEGSAADVLFHRGPVSLALRPICLSTAVSAVRVEVDVAPAPAGPETRLGSGPAGAEVHSPATASWAPSAAWPGAAEGGPPPPAWANGPAAEPVGPVEPLGDSRPVGLLALIATVCVAGVSAGAIRAIIAQRATRTVVA